jgi:hypothetical protein
MPAPLMRPLPDLTPEERTALRYHCGFGCVRCGVTIYQYLSLPVLPDARKEPAATATMLCPVCHQLVEDGRLTPAQAYAFHASPLARQRHFARDRLPFSNELPELVVGGSRIVKDTPIPFAMNADPILLFAPPRQGVGATRISVRLGDMTGEPVQIVDGNEWLATDGAWAFAHRGDRYAFTAARGEGLLVLRIVQRNRIAIEHLRTTIRGMRIEATPDWVQIGNQRFIDRVASGVLIGMDL